MTARAAPLDELHARLASSEERIAELEARLAEAEETLQAIRTGEVDALVVSGPDGDQIFALEGADHAYRLLVEAVSALLIVPPQWATATPNRPSDT